MLNRTASSESVSTSGSTPPQTRRRQPKSVWRGSAAAFGASVAVVTFGFATSFLVARGLGPLGKGSFDLSIATAGLLALVVGWSLPGGIAYAVARQTTATPTLARILVVLALAQAIGAALLLVLGSALPMDLIGPMAPGSIAAIATIVGTTALGSGLRGILVGSESIGRASMLDLAGRALIFFAVAAVLAAGLVLGFRPDYVQLLWATGAAGVALSLLAWAALGDARRGARGPAGIRSILDFALPAHLGNLVQFLNYRLDLFLIAWLAGVAAVGVYALAVSFAQLVWLAPGAIATALLPRVASEAVDGTVGTDVRRVARISLAISGVVALALAVLGPLTITVVFGPAFQPAGLQLVLLLPGVALFGPATVLAAYIGGKGRQRLNFYIALVALGVTVTLDLLLIPGLAGSGAAIASSLSYATTAVLTFIVASRVGSFALADLLVPRPGDFAVLGSALRGIRERH